MSDIAENSAGLWNETVQGWLDFLESFSNMEINRELFSNNFDAILVRISELENVPARYIDDLRNVGDHIFNDPRSFERFKSGLETIQRSVRDGINGGFDDIAKLEAD